MVYINKTIPISDFWFQHKRRVMFEHAENQTVNKEYLQRNRETIVQTVEAFSTFSAQTTMAEAKEAQTTAKITFYLGNS